MNNLNKKEENVRPQKLEVGDFVVCTHSASCGYVVGDTYEVSKNEDGYKGIVAKDGFFDLLSLVLSTFKKAQ